ncbi:bifunctional oligoribonuclease/PAP phosphatase NrnA [Frisingicoccus sp.]|uniref:DHH family phosphoesterase n=1 Tax=Frisingicoccus sp. TaxID=1918627 RepID=UPI002EA74604|nr:bifunctional oligoribonuclease/PAP phosphatase NrnA [Frisingicoccus sp.]
MKSFLESQIMESRTVAIVGHTRPDGDCVGSCMGLYNYIKDNYPEIQVDVYLESIMDSYKIVKRTEEIRQPDGEDKIYDVCICLDTSQKNRMTEGAEPYFDKAKQTINIDHHVSNTGFAGVNHVVSTASSASEVVYDLLNPEKITLAAAEALYMGIICDSGVFKYSSTSEHTMQIAGHLMSIGVDSSRWIDEVFYERTYTQAKLLGQALLNSQTAFDGRCIYTLVDREMFDRFGADRNDLEGIVEQLRLTKGAEVAILMSETEEGTTKFSFRSKRYVDVNQVAGLYGGGGHVRAAGCTVQGNYKEALKRFLDAIEGQLATDV